MPFDQYNLHQQFERKLFGERKKNIHKHGSWFLLSLLEVIIPIVSVVVDVYIHLLKIFEFEFELSH